MVNIVVVLPPSCAKEFRVIPNSNTSETDPEDPEDPEDPQVKQHRD